MDTIENVDNIIDENKPVEKPKRRRETTRKKTQRQRLGVEDPTGLITQPLKTLLISEYI